MVHREAPKQIRPTLGVADILRPLAAERLKQLADDWGADEATAEAVGIEVGPRLLEVLAELPGAEGRALAAKLGLDAERLVALARPPETRADCADGLRPCPYTSCRYFIESRGGPPVCVLDVADDGGTSLTELGRLLGVSRQAVEQVMHSGLERFYYHAWRMGIDARLLIRRGPSETDRPSQRPLDG